MWRKSDRYTLRREHLDELPEDAEELSWGNSVYKIRFEERDRRPMFGHRYWFFLQDAVDDVPEYVVHWDNFVRCVACWILGYRRHLIAIVLKACVGVRLGAGLQEGVP